MTINSIPALDIVAVNPSVLSAGGSALDLIAVILSTSTRLPLTGTNGPAPTQFASQVNVSSFFGPSAPETALAGTYFAGFDGSQVKPGNLLFAQYNPFWVPALLRGGNPGLTLTALQALSGSLTVPVDGYSRVAAAINLSSANSFSAAAGLIQTGLNAAPTTTASITGSIVAESASFTASAAANVLTVTAVANGTLTLGATVNGTGIAAGTVIDGYGTGTGGVGTYFISNSANVASEGMTSTWGLLTVTNVASGTLAAGQTLLGSGVQANQQIVAQLSGTSGLTGTYSLPLNGTVGSEALTTQPTPVGVSYDSVAGGFVISSGVSGVPSTVGYATGTLAASLGLIQQTGAVLSQGAGPATPSAFMTALTQQSQNWATFMLAFDPDYGSGNAQKLLFGLWTAGTNDRYLFSCWDMDVTPTLSADAPSSLGELLEAASANGTAVIYTPTTSLNTQVGTIAAFLCGAIASIDFEQVNGRVTMAFRSQSGLFADVTNQTVAHNLGGNPQSIGDFGNGYNFYGSYATANDQFVFFNRGIVSGAFEWIDSYVNQIWLTNALQLAMVELLVNNFSIPYNATGYALVEAACMDPINAAVSFGAIRAGVPLSAAQIAEVNNAAGKSIDTILSTRGWYLVIVPASPQVRAARASPQITLFYMDGQSIQALTLASIEVQ